MTAITPGLSMRWRRSDLVMAGVYRASGGAAGGTEVTHQPLIARPGSLGSTSAQEKAPDGGIRGGGSQRGGTSGGEAGRLRGSLMSGAEEGGGEPSSGIPPTKKAPTVYHRRSLRGSLWTTAGA